MTTAAAPDFFDDRREWSRWKHDILRRYLPKFAAILGSWHPTIYYVDGFAGAGTYSRDNSAPPVAGSPLIAAEIAATMAASQRRPYQLRCINVEPKVKYYADLDKATVAYKGGIVENLRGTFKQRLSQILDAVGSCPTLVFLDPFGYKGMEWDAMSQLASRAARARAKTELLINFNVGKIDRDGGWLDSYGHPAAPSFVQGLNELFGTDAWQRIECSGLPVTERNDKLTELYMRRLAEAFDGFVASYPVRTIAGQLKYHMLFVTSSRRGVREMGDVLYRVDHDYADERERIESAKPRQLTLLDEFGPPPPPDPKQDQATLVVRLAEDMYAVGKKQRQITFGGLQDRLGAGPEWFGKVITPHYRKACAQLIRQGRIDRDKETGIEDKTILRFA